MTKYIIVSARYLVDELENRDSIINITTYGAINPTAPNDI